MDHRRFSRIAHQRLRYAAPIGDAAVDALLDILPLVPADAVLDVGCGRGELLLRLVERFSARGVGVDHDEESIARARAMAERRDLADRVTFVASPARDAAYEEPFRLAISVGASHAWGGCGETLAALSNLVLPGGYVLLGEGFWRKPPDPDYLASFGGTAEELRTHHENVSLARDRGLGIVWSRVSTDAEWDRYEGLYRVAMHRHLEDHPEDPEAAAFRERSERWYDGYLRWGRDTMGFALYLFQRPPFGRT